MVVNMPNTEFTGAKEGRAMKKNQESSASACNELLYRFGSMVSASEKLVRRSKTENRENKTNGHSSRVETKYWGRTPAKITGLFIGIRTLYDGDREWWGEDTGYTFTPRSHFRAALVVPSERENPVLVPLDSISVKV
jgi:hypothetical protein